MAEPSDSDAVPYRTLFTDPALVSVFFVSGAAAFGTNAVPVALPRVGDAFGLTESEIGLVMSAFTLAVLVMVPVVGVLADVYGRRAVVIPSLLLFGLSGLATLWVVSYPTLLVLRTVQGVAFAGTLPLTPTLTGDLYTGTEGSAAQGIRSGINGFASAVAPIVAGVLAVVAWQYPFVLFALAFPVAGIVYRYYPASVGSRGDDGDGGGAGVGDGLPSAIRTYWTTIWEAADRRLALLFAGGFTLFFLKGGFRTFLPVFVVSGLGSTVTAAGTVLGVYGGTRVVISPLSGSVVARLGRKYAIVLGTGVAALGMGAIPFTSNLFSLGVATACFALGEAVLNPVLNDAVAAFAVDEQRAGIMSGLQIAKNVALTLAPVLMGTIIVASGFEGAFLLAAALGVGYGLVIAVRFARPVNT